MRLKWNPLEYNFKENTVARAGQKLAEKCLKMGQITTEDKV